VVDGPDTADARKAAIAASAKPSCLVVDFVGNAGKHKLVTSADVLGGKVSEEAMELAVARVKKAGGPMRMAEALDEAEAELHQREQARLAEVARRARLVATARFTTQSVDPFDVLHLEPVKARGWDNVKSLTEKQRSLLAKQGINPNNVTFAQGKQLIGEILRRWDGDLCSFKQAKVLKKYGYPTDVGFSEASRIIDALAKNGWHRPALPPKGDPAWN